jgi:hypothetical protein
MCASTPSGLGLSQDKNQIAAMVKIVAAGEDMIAVELAVLEDP